jgi:SAM-dependent methyltransferase
MDMPAFLQRAPMVVKHGNQRAMQILVHSGILQYLNYDITDKIELLPNLWVACNETARSKLVSFILDQARLDKLAFLKTAQKIFEADQEAFLEFHRWIGMRDESLQEILNYIQIDNNIITDIEKIRYNLRLSAEEAHKKGNSLLWFEQLYSEAKRNPENIPWASLRPNEHLISWIKQFSTNVNSFTGKRALIVGCGLGDDAIALSEIGMEVYAFDIAKSSIEWCKERFPKSKVHWSVNDLKHLPSEWCGTFDLVVEIHILQAVHPDVRDELAAALIPLLGENGQLLCIGRKKEEDNRDLIDNIGPPWPLKKSWFELWFSELELIDYTDISESIKNPLGNVIEIKRYRANFQRQF